jgi:hypothetical protein
MRSSLAAIFVLLGSAVLAQDKPQSVPLLGPKPVFVPGMYESESRNSHFQGQPIKSKACIASPDYDRFLADTMAQYRASPQFEKTCALSQTEQLANGFALAMACPGVKAVITYRFSKDLVADHRELHQERSVGLVIDPDHDAADRRLPGRWQADLAAACRRPSAACAEVLAFVKRARGGLDARRTGPGRAAGQT